MEHNDISVGLDIGTTKIVAMIGRRNEYGKIELLKEEKESPPTITMFWTLGIIILVVLLLLILNKLNIVKFEKNIVMLLLTIALLLIIGLFVFNAYNITNNLNKTAIKNYSVKIRTNELRKTQHN